jgi:hypothetical protein
MQSGELWERTTPVLRIEGNESGYWPTPTTMDMLPARDAMDLAEANRVQGGRKNRVALANLREAIHSPRYQKIFPANTPSGNWPTPTCSDAFTDKLKSDQQKEGSMHSVNLSQAVRMWPTPTAQPSGGDAESFLLRKGRKPNGAVTDLGAVVGGGGQLNATWVEWLMHWPLFWTDLSPMRSDHFKEWVNSAHWWAKEPEGIPRVATGVPKRADRLKAIGNGQVPAAASLAWNTLYQRIEARLSA